MLLLLVVLVIGAGVSATSPRGPPPKSPIPSGPYVQPKCGPNEYFELCSYPCPPQNCSTLWTKYQCQETCCKPECRCKDGFLRDDKSGKCIRQDECFSPCGPLENFVRGSSECQKTCANYKVTGPERVCKPFTGCVCNKGLVRRNDDGTGVCILPKQCPTRKCPLFEHWEDCPSVCQKETCMSKNPDYICLEPLTPLPCKPRCICDKGYLRNTFGDCIPEKHCPVKKCPMNEDWRCASMCAEDSCKTLEPGFKCPPGIISVCIPVCACKDGFLRNDKGICIPRDFCPASVHCGINEVAVECATVNPPQTCESVYTTYKPIANVTCKPGCDCRPGYLRNKHNICVPSEFCPTVPQNQCGPNQEYKECGTACEPSCADLDNPNQICTDQCVAGCFCKEGFIKDYQGNCIERNKCPLPVCTQPNEEATECGSYCNARTCEDYKRTDIVCPAVCVRGCFCKKGYVRNAYGVCISTDQCPSEPICLQANEEYQSCGSSCPDNCDNYLDTRRICTANCVAGCNCKKGFVRNLKDKTCVKPEQCPSKDCTGVNESLNLCASYCPVTCANRITNGDWVCIAACRVACDCIPGTLRNDSGVCVPVDQCTPPVCRQNQKYLECGTACPLTCDNYKNPPKICTKQCVADCFCEDGFVRDRNLRCVKPENCEPICPAGEKFNECSAHCQDTCENFDKPNRICTYQCQSGCVCEEGTVRRKDGKCVSPRECLPQPTCANGTEVFSPCSAHCEPTCENSSPNQPCSRICKPGCKCIDGLVRRKDGKCVKVDQCSQQTCPGNEVFDPCSAHCEPTCENNGPNRVCTAICKPGCKCGEGLVRRKDGKCVKLKDCPNSNQPCSDPNAERVECGSQCPSTCAKPISGPCIQSCKQNACVCKKGFILLEDGGKCVPVDQCPKDAPCNGDSNAVIKANPIPCPSICAAPNAFPSCKKYAPEIGCECKPGYLKSNNDFDAKCIKPDECPGGNPCGVNGTFVGCNFGCPTNNCPVNDNRGIIACSPPFPCPSGCACKLNYRKRSSENIQCILASDCPPVKCTRQNEVWSPCPSACLRENCADVNDQPTTCNTLVLNCQPQCICKKGHFRDDNGLCVPANQCPNKNQCSDPNAERVFPKGTPQCEPTCANPNPASCTTSNAPNKCACKKGYILSEKGGKCVPVDQCPKDAPCNGDSNAVIKANPIPCPSICAAPNAFPSCKKYAPEIGCECKPGYLKSNNDFNAKCIKPDECPGGNPCGVNGTFVWCNAGCPNSNCPVNDNRGVIPCSQPFPCPSGCACKLNYRKRSFENIQCILASDCPPVKCTRQNEVWSPCPSACLRENCADVNNQPTTCNTLVLNCQPQCICKKGHFRDDNGLCVPANQCPNKNQCSDPNAERVFPKGTPQCEPTCADPNPASCTTSNAPNKCACKKGYILSEKGGKCVPVDQCPKDAPCNGDSNAVIKANPIPCPSICAAPNAFPSCKKYAPEIGCECKPGYLKSNNDFDAKCIKPDECPGGNPCGVNGTFVGCNFGCPTNNCPVNDNRGIIACSPPFPCPSGCACKLNYRKRSSENIQCILASDCPPVKCTRQNEVWSPCPSACLRENCADVNDQPTTCNTLVLNCQPQCICKKGHFRNDNGLCVPAKQCLPQNTCGPNQVYKECGTACEPSCADLDNPSQICTDQCVAGCFCKEGFIKDNQGNCIERNKCPLPVCTKPNEEATDCGSYCNVRTCEDYKRTDIVCAAVCVRGCFCKKGYVRNAKGICIPTDQCPPGPVCLQANEEYQSCGSSCPDNCDNYLDTGRICTENCVAGCNCKKGFVRNLQDKTCVKPEQCPKNKPCSDPNAERVECAPAPQCRPTCADRNPGPCILICAINECVCKKGYILSEKGGKCIPADQCPAPQPTCANGTEVYSPCSAHCEPTCENSSPYQPCTRICKPGCKCIDGLVRRKDGKCVKVDQCSQQTCPGDEVFDPCSAHCEPTCENNSPNRPCTLICKPGCKCGEGLVRRKDGKCVKIKDCSVPIKCKANEVYNPCRQTCPPQTCASIYTSYSCLNNAKCEPGCDCISEYLRNGTVNDPCIPSSQCPAPIETCPLNEHYEKDTHRCEISCAILKIEPVLGACDLHSACMCNDGYVRNDKGICIKRENCPRPACGPNEHYEVKRSKCDLTCKNKDREALIGPCRETSGCFCNDGFYRNTNGICVTKKQCPKPITCPANEVLSECYNSCHTTCKTRIRGDGRACSLACVATGCLCKPDYLRHDNGTCVPISQCSPPKCNENETYSSCGTACPETCLNKGGNCTTSCTKQCVEGCFCSKGFVRAEDDSCVKPKDCPPPTCNDPNEVFDKCPPTCPPGDNCSNLWSRFDCSKFENCCKPGCRCKPGYYRNNGKCITTQQCIHGEDATEAPELSPQ